ncbi:MAG TPA: O-antigen ligase family protein [Gaiellaceae bacterium]|nr:O-antigen ligase family protein [Gaiellaceae bacterium]
MDEAGLAELAGIVGAGGAALAILAGRRVTLLAGFALLALAEGLLAVSIAGTGALDKAASPTAAAAGLGGLLLVAAAAAVFVRYPLLTIPALVVAAPFRLPLDFDRDNRFFFALAEGGRLGRLIPLYGVLTASGLAFLYRALRRNEVAGPPRLIAVPAATFLAFASLSLLWTRDIDAGANLLAFFLLPFAALVAVVARADLASWLPRALAVIAIGLASLFAAVGLWQQATEELLFYEPALEVANAYSPFFRVTSLFTDPSLYGRHVVLGFAVLLVLFWAGRIHLALAVPLMALMFAGLYFSYSQSSMAALFVVTAAVTIVAGDPLARRTVLAATAAAILVATGFVAVEARDQSIRELTSGRWQRAELTIDVVQEQPLFGVGLGAQPKVSRELGAGRSAREARFVSHTTPLTVAAELGLVGFALYVLLLAAAVRMLLILREAWSVLALALGAVLLALFTHALAYSGFFEDPITWLTLGIGAAYLAVPAPARERERAPAESAPVGGPQPVPTK